VVRTAHVALVVARQLMTNEAAFEQQQALASSDASVAGARVMRGRRNRGGDTRGDAENTTA